MPQTTKEAVMTEIDATPSALTFWMGGFRGPGYDIDSDGVTVTYDETKIGTTCPLSEEIVPSPRSWDKFWHRLDAMKIWDWDSEYSNPEVRDGTLWTLEIAHGGKSIMTRGDNAYPSSAPQEGNGPSDEFSALLVALSQLCGGREIA